MKPLELFQSYVVLFSLTELKENWDGEGAKPFSEALIRRVVEILTTLDKVPEIYPTGRDSIQLEYHKITSPVSMDYLEFEFFENGDLKLFRLFENGEDETRYIFDSEVNIEVELFYQNNFIKKRGKADGRI